MSTTWSSFIVTPQMKDSGSAMKLPICACAIAAYLVPWRKSQGPNYKWFPEVT